MSSKKLTFLLAIIGLSFIFSQTARAQETKQREIRTEHITASDALGIWLPSGAEKITDETVPAVLKHRLAKTVAETVGGNFKQYNPQYLVWKNAEYRTPGDAAAILDGLTEKVTKMGYRFAPGKTEHGITAFRIDDEATGKTLVGFYTATDDGLLWSWVQVFADEN